MTPTTSLAGSSIDSICLKFDQHANARYRQAHHKLNTQYSGIIDIDNLVEAAKEDIPSLVTSKVIEQMNLAPAQAQRATQMFETGAMTLRWHTYEHESYCRLSMPDYAIRDAVKAERTSLRLSVNINRLHFKDDFNASNFADIGTDPFPDVPSTPVTNTPNNTAPPATPQDFAAAIIAAVSPNTQGRNVNPTGGNQTQQTGNIINPASLPPDVRARLLLGEKHDVYLTKEQRGTFDSTTPDITDPAGNTMRKQYHFMDGPHRLITRSGDLFYFSKWDEKKQKMFISRSPKPSSKIHDPPTIRDWYYKFHAHAKQYGIYIHNYFDFRSLSGDPKGFTCGDDTNTELFDVPRLLDARLREWDSTIHAALQDIFATSGTTEFKIVQNKHGRGYEALFDIIRPNHPEHDTYPSLLIRDRPVQREKQSISDYFNEYVNYLKLSSYLTNVSMNLNDARERETFIGNLRQGRDFLDKTYDERHSNDPTKQAMYQQGNIVGTLESVAKRIRPSRHIPSHGSPILKRELTFNRQQPRRTSPLKPASTTKKVQALDVFDASNPTQVTIPEGLGNAFNDFADKYVNAISSGAIGTATPFDTTRPCAVCDKTGHTFDDCPVLQNVEFLRKHYIQFKLFLKKQTATTAAINHLQAFDDNGYDDTDHPLNENSTPGDFHQGQE